MPKSTRKLLVPIRWPSGRIGRGHLVPDPRPQRRSGFVRVSSGRREPHGMVAYIGPPVTAKDILERWEENVGRVDSRDTVLEKLDEYIDWLGTQSIGAVFRASYDDAGRLLPTKLAERPPSPRIPLPE